MPDIIIPYTMADLFLFLDFETTGLNPRNSEIVEVAAIITDAHLNERARVSMAIFFDRWDTVNGKVHDMHTSSGLVEACLQSLDSVRTASRKVGTLLKHTKQDIGDALGKPRPKCVLAGNSVHFDKGFMEVHMPILCKMIHYHLYDVSAHLRTFSNHGIYLYPEDVEGRHRALRDIEWSLQGARNIYEWLESKRKEEEGE